MVSHAEQLENAQANIGESHYKSFMTFGDLKSTLEGAYFSNPYRQVVLYREIKLNTSPDAPPNLDRLMLATVRYMNKNDGYVFAYSEKNLDLIPSPIVVGNFYRALETLFLKVDLSLPVKVMVIEGNRAVFHNVLNKLRVSHDFYFEMICRKNNELVLQRDSKGGYLFPS